MEKKPRAVKSSKELLSKYNFVQRLSEKAKYVSTEHQHYALELSKKLGDRDHKAIYMHFAKNVPRGILESAASFAIDYPDKTGTGNKGAIFMWKLKQLCAEKNVKIPKAERKLSKKKQYLKKQIKLF